MTNMTRFVVFDNALTGSLPIEFGDMAELEVLSLHQTQMTGDMPEAICERNVEGDEIDILVPCYDERSGSGINCPDDCCICKKRMRF